MRSDAGRLNRILRPTLVGIPLLGLLGGLAAQSVGSGHVAGWIWSSATLPVLLALIVQIVVSMWRREFGLDIVAAMSMADALVFGEHLAAVVVALMYAGGQYLESFAEGRARREMTKLLSRVPRTALRHRGGRLEEVGLDTLEPGDRIMVRRGEVIAVDGAVATGVAVLDQSALTGESLPVQQHAGEAVLSGSTNAGDTFDLVVSARAEASTYAGIVRLVEAAQHSKAPMSRLADRFAMAFLGVTAAIAGGAWIWTGDPIRGLTVLVVATPCPLILAVPVAITSGVSRAAKLGILVKGVRGLGYVVESDIRGLVIFEQQQGGQGGLSPLDLRRQTSFLADVHVEAHRRGRQDRGYAVEAPDRGNGAFVDLHETAQFEGWLRWQQGGHIGAHALAALVST
jgi:cation transport ATPase